MVDGEKAVRSPGWAVFLVRVADIADPASLPAPAVNCDVGGPMVQPSVDESRLTALSQVIHPFETGTEPNRVGFSVPALNILDAAQNPALILCNFANSISPQGWSGSLADIIARRCHAFETLLQNDRPEVRSAARDLIPRIRDSEYQERRRESDESRQRDQRFEQSLELGVLRQLVIFRYRNARHRRGLSTRMAWISSSEKPLIRIIGTTCSRICV